MTRLAIMSDLHIDSNAFGTFELETLIQTLKARKIDQLHLAGDISNDFYGRSQTFIDRLSQDFQVSYNLGNHDMLGLSEQEISSQDLQVQSIGSSQLVSLAGWYDYSFVPQLSLDQHLKNKNNFWFDRRLKRAKSDPLITQDLLERLKEALQGLAGPILVAMHFVPHQVFLFEHPYFRRFNAFMGSQAFHQVFLDFGVKEVVFGHLHHRYKRRLIDGIGYQAKPLGYIREWQLTQNFFKDFPQYQIPESYRLHKRYNAVRDLPEFEAYKEKYLAQEFDQAMTIFEL
ncbi:metallophosphoesterase [Streptococcus oricebi]|uniref:Phosphoesterase n=1 Tax=Streptococcus oricebi TaxID=1547447 RepID=A0ABS5B139_9STRE|nr:metallophosphoesterase [Streptococcus oricebi]MBP2622537.1 phosphoesterase [Streptococcus oricebi]